MGRTCHRPGDVALSRRPTAACAHGDQRALFSLGPCRVACTQPRFLPSPFWTRASQASRITKDKLAAAHFLCPGPPAQSCCLSSFYETSERANNGGQRRNHARSRAKGGDSGHWRTGQTRPSGGQSLLGGAALFAFGAAVADAFRLRLLGEQGIGLVLLAEIFSFIFNKYYLIIN